MSKTESLHQVLQCHIFYVVSMVDGHTNYQNNKNILHILFST